MKTWWVLLVVCLASYATACDDAKPAPCEKTVTVEVTCWCSGSFGATIYCDGEEIDLGDDDPGSMNWDSMCGNDVPTVETMVYPFTYHSQDCELLTSTEMGQEVFPLSGGCEDETFAVEGGLEERDGEWVNPCMDPDCG